MCVCLHVDMCICGCNTTQRDQREIRSYRWLGATQHRYWNAVFWKSNKALNC